jgi:hypothetical protein
MSGDDYRRAMDALARETTMAPESAERIERQLLDAFAGRGATDEVRSRRMKGVVWIPRFGGRRAPWRIWISAAAAVVLSVGSLFVWRANHRLVPVEQRAVASVAPTESRPASAGVSAIEPPPSPVTAAHTPRPHRRPPKKTDVITPSGFVDLPWTAGLPAFESGEIVRMDIPIASLPTYGIDISPGTGKGPVEADVLIGQDGLARQIRLVTTSSRSTQ